MVWNLTDAIVVLLSEAAATRDRLEVYGFDGSRLASIGPPSGFDFYYLSEHAQHGVSVVCVANAPINGWYDWHFRIDIDNGRVVRTSPAK